MHFYEIYNFKVLYQIEEAKMSRFLEKVEASYKVCALLALQWKINRTHSI